MDRPPSPDPNTLPIRQDSFNAPLLPLSNEIPAYTPQASTKPVPVTAGLTGRPAVPRMWDGAMDGPGDRSAKDLTNTKLAKNQLVGCSPLDLS